MHVAHMHERLQLKGVVLVPSMKFKAYFDSCFMQEASSTFRRGLIVVAYLWCLLSPV